jgi:hypothetical protein
MSTLSIVGKIIRKADSKPISDLYVEAWDKDPSSKERLASSVTNHAGVFTIHLDQAMLAEVYKDAYPELYFKIFSGPIQLASTEHDVVVNPRSRDNEIIIPIDYKPKESKPGKTRKYVVKGVILKNDFSPASNYAIAVMDKGLVTDTALAEGKTTESGAFELSFDGSKFEKTGKQSPDVYAKVTTGKKESVTTRVIYNATTVTVINYVIGDAPFPEESEFERLSKKLGPFLKGSKLKEIKLSDRNNPFRLLAEKTGEPEQKIKWLVIARQLAGDTKLPSEFYYALLRGRLANDPALHLTDVFNQDISQVEDLLKKFHKNETIDVSFISLSHEAEKTIESLIHLSDRSIPGALDFAIRNNIVPASLQANRSNLEKEWNNLKTKYRDKRKREFETLLSSTQLKAESVKSISALFDKYHGSTGRLMRELKENKTVSKDVLNEIKAIDRINQMINDPLIATAIKGKLDIRRPEDVRKLARLSGDEWKEIFQSEKSKASTGPALDKKIGALMSSLEVQYPTAAFAGRLERDSGNTSAVKASMLRFFDRYPETELHKTNFDLLFHQKEKELSRDIENADALRTELKTIQRVFKLAPSYSKVKVLLEKNIHSSQGIYNLGKKRFVEKVANGIISKEEAKKIYKKAEHTYAAALSILGDIKSMEEGSALRVLPDVDKTYNNLKHSTMKDFPDWKALFTSTDICECEHCRSVYSPAAYLTDLLKFLNKRGSTTPLVSAKEILFKRRPDIGEIDLNCDNSLIPIPYIDLVCETLEDALAGATVVLTGGIEP